MADRGQIRCFILLATTFASSNPYDAEGALSLLQSIDEAWGEPRPRLIAAACDLQAAAILGSNRRAEHEARTAMRLVVSDLQYRLTRPRP